MVDFVLEWYTSFIEKTNEKDVLVNKVGDLLEGKPHKSCLEVGLGISPYFAKRLSPLFKRYLIVEKRLVNEKLPKGVELIQGDWESTQLNEKFDVIIASHVIYYFKDKRAALRTMLNHLNPGGRIFFVVNGKSSDYGPLKLAFGKMIHSKYVFTYDQLLDLVKGKKVKEYTLPSVIKFKSYDDLFDTLRLSFDTYPTEYQKNKHKLIEYFGRNLRGNKFIIDQKIIEVEN